MNKIKKKLIHFLGGLTQDEHDNLISLADKAHNQSLAKLSEENEKLQRNLRALEWAVEDSRMTGQVNIVRTEKLIKTFSMQNIISQESCQTEEEQIVYAKRNISEQFANILLKNGLIDFKVSDYNFDKIITGTIYVREP